MNEQYRRLNDYISQYDWSKTVGISDNDSRLEKLTLK
jgi:hypothetical protein